MQNDDPLTSYLEALSEREVWNGRELPAQFSYDVLNAIDVAGYALFRARFGLNWNEWCSPAANPAFMGKLRDVIERDRELRASWQIKLSPKGEAALTRVRMTANPAQSGPPNTNQTPASAPGTDVATMAEESIVALGDCEHRTLQAVIDLCDGNIGGKPGGTALAWLPRFMLDNAVFVRLNHAPIGRLVSTGLVDCQERPELPLGELQCGQGRSVTIWSDASGRHWFEMQGNADTSKHRIDYPIKAYQPTEMGRRVAAAPPSYHWLDLDVVEGRRFAPPANDPIMRENTLLEDRRTKTGAATLQGRLVNAANKAGIAKLTDDTEAVARATRRWLIGQGFDDAKAGAMPIEEVIAKLEASTTSPRPRNEIIIRALAARAYWFVARFPESGPIEGFPENVTAAELFELCRQSPLVMIVEKSGGKIHNVIRPVQAITVQLPADDGFYVYAERSALTTLDAVEKERNAPWNKVSPNEANATTAGAPSRTGKGAAATTAELNASEKRWLTVSESARISGADKGVISRAADSGDLIHNDKTGRQRRIDAVDLTRWMLERAAKPDAAESDESVSRLVNKHVRD